MAEAMSAHFDWSSVVIMAAAVADFRPQNPASQKLKKGTAAIPPLELERAPDILAMLSAKRTSQILVGFAAETQHLVKHATDKLTAKGLDLIVANDVTQAGAGFGSEQNAAIILSRTGIRHTFSLRPKAQLAHDILSTIVEFAKNEPRKQTPASVQ
jgi:phosphopantothenoylcysteine decarboxylase/phosphopantothenate--cysteine ligase